MSTIPPGSDESDWISQAEAARLRGVSRQAISKMIRAGRLSAFEFGGHVLVSRREVMGLGENTPVPLQDRPGDALLLLSAFEKLRPEVRSDVFRRLLEKYPVHPFESRMGASAEVILEALDRSGPLTIRMLRGVLAESAFDVHVVNRLEGWTSLPTPKDPPYDFLLDDGNGPIKVQVKLQRSKADRPMLASEGHRRFSPEMFVVETQRTRGGKGKDRADTRPYRFGEFDILVVALHASTHDWKRFFYTVGDWLIPRAEDERLLLKFQPLPKAPNLDWTEDFLTCVSWFRSGERKTIRGTIAPADEQKSEA